MSRSYHFSVVLDTEYNKKIIQELLTHGYNLGFYYFAEYPGFKQYSVKEATKYLTRNSDIDEDLSNIIYICFEGTILYMSCDQNGHNKLAIYFSPTAYIWENPVKEYLPFDYERYLNIFIKFCSKFKMLEMNYETLY